MNHKRPMKISQYLSDLELKHATTIIDDLEPFESTFVDFYLLTFFDFAVGDALLISEDNIDKNMQTSKVQICPTRSIVSFDKKRQQLKIKACIKNLTDKHITNYELTGFVEHSSKYNMNEIDLTNVHRLKEMKFVHEATINCPTNFGTKAFELDNLKAQLISVQADSINLKPLGGDF